MKSIRIEVPASSANLGPGFDALGMALDIVDEIDVTFVDAGDTILEMSGGEARSNLDPANNLLCAAYRQWAKETGAELPGARFTIRGSIPIGKGFGSSAAAIVAGLAAGAYASGSRQARDDILRIASHMEGHADNVSAAMLGGITVSFVHDSRVFSHQVVSHADMGIAIFVPSATLLTAEARACLPKTVPIRDAALNIGRTAYLVTALMWGQWELLGPAMEDSLHQQHRARLIPALPDLISAAREAGAYGAALSGGGPAVVALCPPRQTEAIGIHMETAARQRGWDGDLLQTRIRDRGLSLRLLDVPEGEPDDPKTL
jgi:homoserine kinase